MTQTAFIIVISILLVISTVLAVIFAMRNGKLQGAMLALEDKLKYQEETQRRISDEREKVFESQRKQMEESFKLLSEQNSAGLRRQNTESITELLKPIQDKFTEFDKTIRSGQDTATARDASMRELLKALTEQSRSVGEEARNLANALTGHSKIQGDFGEMLLVDLLRSSGLEEGIQFAVQGVIRDESGHEVKSETGSTMIPDVIVYYPDGSEVIIDSKVSLTAYVNYMNSDSVEDRKRYAKDHIMSVRKHIDELKIKDYASYIDSNHKKVDYNIMFVPMEGAFRLMLEEEPRLWQMAKDARVLIVSQMNLMIVLNMILMSWRRYDQEKNIAEVYKTAGELMSQLKNWMDSFVRIGENLDRAQSAYDDSRKKLVESNQSVIKKIDKLEHLKIAPKRSNAKIKPGTRIVGGQESIIPSELSIEFEGEQQEQQ